MDIIFILGVIWIIGWLVIPMLYGIFIKAPKQFMDGELTKPKHEDVNENKSDTEEEPKEKDIYVDTYKTHAKEFIKEPYVREDNNTQMNTGSREPFYIVIIFVLLIIMFVQYTKYREDSFSRITQCFADVVPDSEQDFCESIYEKYRD